MIDLHLHTTASDGRCTPRELVAVAAAAGVSVIAVTDHDTVDAVGEVGACAAARGMIAVSGIEITAIEAGRDVHMLGYFFDTADPALGEFLAAQRATRVARVQAIGRRLAELGMTVDLSATLAAAERETGRSIGRPQVARAMIERGYVADMREAFDRWLGRGCPAFVERGGPSPEDVIAIVHRAQGLVSLAHPGRTGVDERLPALCEAGLDAVEAYHSDHLPHDIERYTALADRLRVLVTGGSDYHGDPARGIAPGTAGFPPERWAAFHAARARHARR